MSVVGSVRLCQLPRIREAQGRCQPRGETAAAFRPLRIAMPELGYLMRKRIQRIVVAVIAAVPIMAGAWALSRREPPALRVNSAMVFDDAVNRGEMLRQVHGIDTPPPETVVMIPSGNVGRVERRTCLPVTAGRPRDNATETK